MTDFISNYFGSGISPEVWGAKGCVERMQNGFREDAVAAAELLMNGICAECAQWKVAEEVPPLLQWAADNSTEIQEVLHKVYPNQTRGDVVEAFNTLIATIRERLAESPKPDI